MALGGFLFGYFADLMWLMVLGGILVVLDDIVEMAMGILKPLFPVILAIVLAIIITPWYVGIFWASAIFKTFGIYTSLIKVINPIKVIEKAELKFWYNGLKIYGFY